jgi:hypothetical protein
VTNSSVANLRRLSEDGHWLWDAVARVIFDATWMYPAALLVGATGLASVGSKILPRWLAAASTWFAVLLLAMAGVGFLGPLDRLRFLTLPIFLIWIIAVSVVLLRVRATSPSASRTAQ